MQTISGDHNNQVLIRDSPATQVIINGQLSAELWVPPFQRRYDSSYHSDFDLLRSTFGLTQLVGRKSVWDDFLTWCFSDKKLSFRCIAGRGGTGKTRFALELLHALRQKGDWDARFVRFASAAPIDLWAETQGCPNVLLVFDYASDYGATIAASLRRLVNKSEQSGRHMRILLLSRQADWDEGWLSLLRSTSTLDESLSSFFEPQEPIQMEALTYEESIQLLTQFKIALESLLDIPVSPDWTPADLLQKGAFGHSSEPLTLMMAALVATRSGAAHASSLSRTGLAHEVAQNLIKQRLSSAFGDESPLALHMAAYITLCGGLSKEQTETRLSAEAVAIGFGSVSYPLKFVERLHSWLFKDAEHLGPIEPDIVGEAFVIGAKRSNLRQPGPTCVRAAASSPRQVASYLIRISQDFYTRDGGYRGEPIEWLEELITVGDRSDLDLLLAIHAELPDKSLSLASAALRVQELLVSRFRLSADIPSEADVLSDEEVIAVARMAFDLSSRQTGAGHFVSALKNQKVAVLHCRRLIRRNEQRYADELAVSLINLSDAHLRLGEFEEAYGVALEASTMLAGLSTAGTQRVRSLHRKSVEALAITQANMGLHNEALQSGEQALVLGRALAKSDPDGENAELAAQLDNQSTRRMHAGLHAEALELAKEGALLWRSLAEGRSDSYVEELAHSLVILTSVQNSTGHSKDAIASATEAIAIYRTLRQHQVAGSDRGLAAALNNVALAHENEGNIKEALAAAEENLLLRRILSQQNAPANLAGLGGSLRNVARLRSLAGLLVEALQSSEDAVQVHRRLAKALPKAYLSELAHSLCCKADIYGELKRDKDSLEIALEAASISEHLANQDRGTWLPLLAKMLDRLAIRFHKVGARERGLSIGLRCWLYYAELYEANPHLYELPLLANSESIAEKNWEHGFEEAAFKLVTALANLFVRVYKVHKHDVQVARRVWQLYDVAAQRAKAPHDAVLAMQLRSWLEGP